MTELRRSSHGLVMNERKSQVPNRYTSVTCRYSCTDTMAAMYTGMLLLASLSLRAPFSAHRDLGFCQRAIEYHNTRTPANRSSSNTMATNSTAIAITKEEMVELLAASELRIAEKILNALRPLLSGACLETAAASPLPQEMVCEQAEMVSEQAA